MEGELPSKSPSIILLRVVCKDETNLSLDDVLKKVKSVSIHQRNLHVLATETFIVRKNLGPEIMKDVLYIVQKSYNLRDDSFLQRRRNHTVYFGTGRISSLDLKIWEIVPGKSKNEVSLDIFEEKVKLETTGKCPCRLCKRHIGNIGFV